MVFITIGNETKNLTEWSKVLGISRERARQLHNQNKLIPRILFGDAAKRYGKGVLKYGAMHRKTLNVIMDMDKIFTAKDLCRIMRYSNLAYMTHHIIPRLKNDGVIEEIPSYAISRGNKLYRTTSKEKNTHDKR